MFPELLHVGSWTLKTYTIVVEIGIIVGVIAAYKAARRQHMPADAFLDLAIWSVLGGILGSRAWYVIVNWQDFVYDPLRVIYMWEGGLVFQGAIFGALLAMFLFIKRRRLSFLFVADLGALGLPIGHAVGRLACFFEACCYGKPADLPWTVLFPGHNEAVHPTMLYESLANAAIFLTLWHLDKRKPFPGFTLALYLIMYSSVRFLNEFLRGDPAEVVGGMRVAQLVSLGTLAAGIALLVYLRRTRTASAEQIADRQAK